jgi:hypothetical protein
VKARTFGLCLGAALAAATGYSARAQFMNGNYPVIIVPPPPAQNLVLPKPAPRPAPPPQTIPRPAEAPPLEQSQCYQGRTKVGC